MAMKKATKAFTQRFVVQQHPSRPIDRCRPLPTRKTSTLCAEGSVHNQPDKDALSPSDFIRRFEELVHNVSLQQKPDLRKIQKAEEILRRAEDDAFRKSNVIGPLSTTTTPFNRLLRAYVKSNEKQSVVKAQELLERMKYSDHLPYPDTFTYDAVLFACTKSKHTKAPEIAEKVLKEMQSLANVHDSNVAPTLTSYHNIILAHANQSASVYGAAAAAEDWLMHLSNLSIQPENKHLRPTTQAFNHVLQAWATSIENNGADRALQILELMINLKDAKTDPDSISFATVINAFARRNRPEEAELALKRALDYFNATAPHETTIDLTTCLNRTMGAWSKSSRPDAAQRAKDLLDDAYTLASSSWSSSQCTPQQSRIIFAPNADTHYYYVLTLLSNEQEGLSQADEHVREMIQSCYQRRRRKAGISSRQLTVTPLMGTIHTVMKAWTSSHEEKRAQRATDLLLQMIDLADSTSMNGACLADCIPVAGSFAICIDAWTKSGNPETADKVLMLLNLAEKRRCHDAFAYQATVNMLCRFQSTEATYKAVHILRQYKKLADEGRVKWVPSHAIGLYTAVIAGLGRIKNEEAAETALELFKSIPVTGPRAALPTSKTYTALMVCYARIRSQEATRIVFELYLKMKELDANPESKVRLDGIAFKTVLRSLAFVQDHVHFDDVLSFFLCELRSGRSEFAAARDFLVECQSLLPLAGLPLTRRREIETDLDNQLRGLN
ncbi:hypothetical protein MPSEU_000503800 [Mayamaea pseudoterrestris]|nr:hypothetical protein MPSEU_000503800 [Mayamaea pseudoterrestris]